MLDREALHREAIVMLDREALHREAMKNAIEAHLIHAITEACDLVVQKRCSDEEMRLFLAAALVRLGLVPGEPEGE